MKLIVGLGNPGPKYSHTRHNVGFLGVEAFHALVQATAWENYSSRSLIAMLDHPTSKVLLLKPQTFMNESGLSVAEVLNFYKIPTTELWIIHDDLDLTPGRIKLDSNASSAGHRGVQSIIDHLGTQDFKRIRYGIGKPEQPQPTEEYVLGPLATEATATEAGTALAQVINTALNLGFEVTRSSNNKKSVSP